MQTAPKKPIPLDGPIHIVNPGSTELVIEKGAKPPEQLPDPESRCHICLSVRPVVTSEPQKSVLIPCDQCAEHMRQGIIVIQIDARANPNWGKRPDSVPEGDAWFPQPDRVGERVVITDDAAKRLIRNPELRLATIARRVLFIDYRSARKAGILKARRNTNPTEHDQARIEEARQRREARLARKGKC